MPLAGARSQGAPGPRVPVGPPACSFFLSIQCPDASRQDTLLSKLFDNDRTALYVSDRTALYVLHRTYLTGPDSGSVPNEQSETNMASAVGTDKVLAPAGEQLDPRRF